MKKILLKICFFIILFFFLNIKSPESDELLSINYYDDTQYIENKFTIKLNDFNIFDLKKFENYNINIISIIPIENKYNVSKVRFNNHNIDLIINDSISYYSNYLMNNNYIDEAISIKTKGFGVSKIKLITTYEELLKLEKKINFKILRT